MIDLDLASMTIWKHEDQVVALAASLLAHGGAARRHLVCLLGPSRTLVLTNHP